MPVSYNYEDRIEEIENTIYDIIDSMDSFWVKWGFPKKHLGYLDDIESLGDEIEETGSVIIEENDFRILFFVDKIFRKIAKKIKRNNPAAEFPELEKYQESIGKLYELYH